MIAAAEAAHAVPRAMIFNDPTLVMSDWDYKLLKAHHFLMQMKSGQFPVWIAESDRMMFQVHKKISRPEAALAKAQKGDKEDVPGRYYTIEAVVGDGGEWPTLTDWIQDRNEKEGKK